MMTMPGLPGDPSAARIDLADDGTILGLLYSLNLGVLADEADEVGDRVDDLGGAIGEVSIWSGRVDPV